MADIRARLHDGEVARTRQVIVEVAGSSPETGTLIIRDQASAEVYARWPRHALFAVTASKTLLRIGTTTGAHQNARLTIEGAADVAALFDTLPTLAAKQKANRAAQGRMLVIATAALGSVIAAFVFGVPLISRQIVALIPTAWERDFGDRIVGQAEEFFAQGSGTLERCDPRPGSEANRAIARFVAAATAGVDTGIDIRVDVVRNPVPNAFALPGGQVYYFSSLLEASSNSNAFAGVLAHEIGHAIERHGMEQVVATAGTGLLVGLVVGDVFGISPALFVGQQLINTRFSRDHELAADQFALGVAQRLEFDAGAMATVLQAVAADDVASRAMSLIATHPLTDEREAVLAAGVGPDLAGKTFFTPNEWTAIQLMCSPDQLGTRQNTNISGPNSEGQNQRDVTRKSSKTLPAPGTGKGSKTGR
ncbi:MAG: M48 family metallopeptidase [Alphaproteobacteria bacterium]|nr:M48 family metallopeptidase [Alphaproteobacteria bacterium]